MCQNIQVSKRGHFQQQPEPTFAPVPSSCSPYSRSGRKRRRPAEADDEKEESFRRDRFHAENQRILKDLATRTSFARRRAKDLGKRKLLFDGSNNYPPPMIR